MLFIVHFTNKPGLGDFRKRLLPAHLEWLDKHQSAVLLPGSLRTEPEAVPVGGLWIVEANSKEEVESLLKSDPFMTEGLRERYEILHWSKAFPERKVPI